MSAVSTHAERAHAQKNYVAAIIAISRIVSPEVCEKSRARLRRLEGFARELLEDINLDLRNGLETTTSVEELLRSSCDLVRDRADAARVVIAIRCAEGSIHCDAASIREALSNLLANAIEASPPGKTIEVTAAVSAAGNHVWTIEDSGGGIAPALVRQLGSPVRSTRSGGSGVGVAIAASIIRRHGGSIHFASQIGRGTRVTIMFGDLPVNCGKSR